MYENPYVWTHVTDKTATQQYFFPIQIQQRVEVMLQRLLGENHFFKDLDNANNTIIKILDHILLCNKQKGTVKKY